MKMASQAVEWLNGSRRKLATAGVCVMACLLAAHVLFGANGWMAYTQKQQTHQRILREVEQLQKENEQLQQQIRSLKSDPKAIEKEAREQLKYTRPGEVVYTLPAPPAGKPVTSSAQAK